VSSDNPLHHLGKDVRILGALIDALIAGLYANCIYQWRVEGLVETAIRKESNPKSAATTKRDNEAMTHWGVVDQDGIYRVAGLSDRETEIARWHYDLGLKPGEMATYFGGDPIRMAAQLYRVKEKLEGLGRRTEL
jgi:hypothetical protein